MSTQVELEADVRFTADVAERVLRSVGASIEGRDYGFQGTFPDGLLRADFLPRNVVEPPFTDGLEDAVWKTRSSISFNVTWSSSNHCGRQLFGFISSLAEQTDVYFALSVQREKLLSLKDESGLRHYPEVWAAHFGDSEKWGAVVH